MATSEKLVHQSLTKQIFSSSGMWTLNGNINERRDAGVILEEFSFLFNRLAPPEIGLPRDRGACLEEHLAFRGVRCAHDGP